MPDNYPMRLILIAEDEEILAGFIDKGLRKNGYQTAIATDGEQALQLALSGQFDLLLLDLGLPIKNGWTVLAELEANSASITTILVTARDDAPAYQKRFSNRVKDYISKPFRFIELLERIRVCLGEK